MKKVFVSLVTLIFIMACVNTLIATGEKNTMLTKNQVNVAVALHSPPVAYNFENNCGTNIFKNSVNLFGNGVNCNIGNQYSLSKNNANFNLKISASVGTWLNITTVDNDKAQANLQNNNLGNVQNSGQVQVNNYNNLGSNSFVTNANIGIVQLVNNFNNNWMSSLNYNVTNNNGQWFTDNNLWSNNANFNGAQLSSWLNMMVDHNTTAQANLNISVNYMQNTGQTLAIANNTGQVQSLNDNVAAALNNWNNNIINVSQLNLANNNYSTWSLNSNVAGANYQPPQYNLLC
jgi:hypothetical protein